MVKNEINYALAAREKALSREKELKKKGMLSTQTGGRELSVLFERAAKSFSEFQNKVPPSIFSKISSQTKYLANKAIEYSPYPSVQERIRKQYIETESSPLDKLMKEFENTWGFFAIGTLILSLFFVSSNLTGYVISNISLESSRLIGICFFVCGLIFTFLFLRKKK